MARSKQTLSSLLLQVEQDVREKFYDLNLLVIKINSTLNNSENKILSKFFDALGLTGIDLGQTQGVEMNAKVSEYFAQHPGLTVLFIFEDIDFYVESTK